MLTLLLHELLRGVVTAAITAAAVIDVTLPPLLPERKSRRSYLTTQPCAPDRPCHPPFHSLCALFYLRPNCSRSHSQRGRRRSERET